MAPAMPSPNDGPLPPRLLDEDLCVTAADTYDQTLLQTMPDYDNVPARYVLAGTTLGIGIALIISLVDAREATATKWLILLPGQLVANALLCVVVPSVFVHSLLGAMHIVTRNKHKPVLFKMLAYFFVTTLWASIVGAIVSFAFASAFLKSDTLAMSMAVSNSSAISFRCPLDDTVMQLQDNGTMMCVEANATNFVLQDLSGEYQVQHVDTLSNELLEFLETVFPINVAESFVRGEILSLVIIGAALGVALLSSSHDGEGQSSMLFLLAVQAEIMLNMLLRFILDLLPLGMVFMSAAALVQITTMEQESQVSRPTLNQIVTFVGALLMAMAINISSVLGVASFTIMDNPIDFSKHLIPAQFVALGSSSALLALPATMRSIAKTKLVSMPLAHFVCSAGAILNKSGRATHLSAMTVYVMYASDLEDSLTFANVMIVVLASVVCSLMAPPIPRGGCTVLGAVLLCVMPSMTTSQTIAMLAFAAAMDWLCDPLVAVVSVTNNALIALMLAYETDERFVATAMNSRRYSDAMGNITNLNNHSRRQQQQQNEDIEPSQFFDAELERMERVRAATLESSGGNEVWI